MTFFFNNNKNYIEIYRILITPNAASNLPSITNKIMKPILSKEIYPILECYGLG